MTSRKCQKKKLTQQLTEANRSSPLEHSQALLDKFSVLWHLINFVVVVVVNYYYNDLIIIIMIVKSSRIEM